MKTCHEMFAFLVVDKDGDESVPAAFMEILGTLAVAPLMGADIERVEALRPIAQKIATASGKSIRLAKFTCRQDLETIHPERHR